MAAKSSDKALLTFAALLLLASALAFGFLVWRGVGLQRVAVAPVQLSDAPYAPSVEAAPPAKTEVWTPPPSQSRGREWIYDAFTPAEIFYNARSKQFTVKPPTAAADDVIEEAFGLELVTVRPEPFRLQLIGYVGAEGNWRGTFENKVSGEVFLGAAGKSVPKLGLTIVSFEVRPQPIALTQSMTTQQRVATAVVRDDKTGATVTITHRERHFTGAVSAFVAEEGAAATREVRAGDVFKIGPATYRIEKVQLSPAQIEVTKEAPTLPQPDRRPLFPREAETPEAPEKGGDS